VEQGHLKTQLLYDTLEPEGQQTEILEEFEGRADELIPMLQRVQKALGYLPESALDEIAHRTGLPLAKVFGVATFYAQFRLQPVGKHIIRLCRGTACHVRRSGRIQKDIQALLGISPGETSRDRLFTLETVACFGSCALAPVVVVNDSVLGRVNPSKVREIVEALRRQEHRSPMAAINKKD
jgi:NADH-quinone oxidoreductase subunit E